MADSNHHGSKSELNLNPTQADKLGEVQMEISQKRVNLCQH